MKKYTLQNGIPVILHELKGTNAVTALILFKVGSRNENKRNNGVSHFVEHLFFKGTEKRPTTLDISKELDGLGADFNAFTSKDFTGYYVKVASQHTKKAIDILEDILFHPIFDAEEITRERGVIVEEINMYEDNPMSIADEFSEQLMYGENHPLGYRIAGPPENIKSISREAILEYRDTYYHTDNMVIILSGNLPQDTYAEVKKRFANSPAPKARPPRHKVFQLKQRSPRLHIERKDTAQAHLALTFPGPSYTAKQLPATQLLATILGGSMSSRLFINVRERQGLCYYIRAGVSPYEDVGAFSITAGFDRTRIHQATKAIISEIVAVRDNGVTPEELQNAKQFIRGKTSIRMEDSENVASRIGMQALFQKEIGSQQEFFKKIDAVTTAQVQAAAKKIFVKQHGNLAVIGPYTKRQEQSFKKHLNF